MARPFETRFDYVYFWWLLFPALLFIIPVILFFRKMQEGFYSFETLGYYLILPVFMLTGVSALVVYLRREAPKIQIHKEHFLIQGQKIPFTQVAKIRLFVPTKVFSQKSKIILKNGHELMVPVSIYANGPALSKNLELLSRSLKNQEPQISPVLEVSPVKVLKATDFSGFTLYRQSISNR